MITNSTILFKTKSVWRYKNAFVYILIPFVKSYWSKTVKLLCIK